MAQRDLTVLEEDVLGDMAQDSHGVWEIFEFVAFHNPTATSREIQELGIALIRAWAERGWIQIASDEGCPWADRTLTELVAFLQARSGAANQRFEGAPELELTEKAYIDVDWLSPR